MNTQPLAQPLPPFVPALVETVAAAAASLPAGRDRVAAVDLVVACLAADNAAARLVDVIAPDRIAEVESRLRAAQTAVACGEASFGELDLPDGVTLSIDRSAREVLDRITRTAAVKADTKTLLIAEAERPRSALVAALVDVAAGGAPETIAAQLAAIARRTPDDPRRDARRMVFRPHGALPEEDDVRDRTVWAGPITRSPSPPDATPDPVLGERADAVPSAAPRDTGGAAPPALEPTIDLLARARASGDADRAMLADPAAVARVLAAIERNPLTAVVADSAVTVDEVVAAIAAQLALDASAVFRYRSVIALEPALLATQPAGTLRAGIVAARDGLLYLPNLPRALDAARSSGAGVDLRRGLARAELRVVGTVDERDVGRLWPPEDPPPHEMIYLDGASIEQTIAIMRARRDALARVASTPALAMTITDAAIDTAARAADRYFREPPPPAGAMRLILDAGTAIKLRAAPGMDRISDARVAATPTIDADDVLLALERLTGIEAQLDDQARLLGIETFLSERVVGQAAAVAALADAIRQARAGLKDANRPIGSFVFMGPSGVGKTELAKALAEFMFGDADAILRLDMSEYHERHTIARLVGAPPGYVGYDEGGQLTEPIRRKPYQLVLFDEIEKAHPDVHNVLLQIMDDGRLTDSRGRTVDFRNTVIIMTGNVGSDYFRVEPEIGRDKVVAAVREAARDVFRPEFLGRVDDFIVFNSLGATEMRQIVEIQLRQLNRKLGAQGLTIALSDALKQRLASTGYAPELGARPLRGEIRNLIERPLARQIIEGAFVAGDVISADAGPDGDVRFEKAKVDRADG